MVGARLPQHVLAAHALETAENVLQRIVERVAHMQRAGDVGRRNDDAVWRGRWRAPAGRRERRQPPPTLHRCGSRPRRAGICCRSLISGQPHRGVESPRRARCQCRAGGERNAPAASPIHGSPVSRQTLTSGTFGTVPRRGGVSSPRGPVGPDPGLRRGAELRLALARRGTGSFSGRGFTGPSG